MNTYSRTWALDDISIVSRGAGGDGRTVEAYAAVFDTPTEINDQHGHYIEVIDRTSFNRTLSHGIDRVNVFYHHGMTLYGTPSDLGAVPLGRPVEVRPDGRGLRTVSRYNKSQLADAVLESIRNGDIKGQSFRGRIVRSSPAKVPRARDGELPTVTRMELGLSEYGPTPTPYYVDAAILAVRSMPALAATLAALDGEEREGLLRMLSQATPLGDPAGDTATPDEGPGAEDSPADAAHSGRLRHLRLKARVRDMGV